MIKFAADLFGSFCFWLQNVFFKSPFSDGFVLINADKQEAVVSEIDVVKMWIEFAFCEPTFYNSGFPGRNVFIQACRSNARSYPFFTNR